MYIYICVHTYKQPIYSFCIAVSVCFLIFWQLCFGALWILFANGAGAFLQALIFSGQPAHA